MTLSENPGVQEVAALCLEEVHREKEIVSYLVGEAAMEDVPALRGYLKKELPSYMVPSVFVRMESLPLTANGKLDRRALPHPDGAERTSGATYVPPRNELEQNLAQIWKEVLRVEKVGIHDNFFDIGGHSLLSTQIVSRINQRFSVDVSLQQLFEMPTIALISGTLKFVWDSQKPKLQDSTLSEEDCTEVIL